MQMKFAILAIAVLGLSCGGCANRNLRTCSSGTCANPFHAAQTPMAQPQNQFLAQPRTQMQSPPTPSYNASQPVGSGTVGSGTVRSGTVRSGTVAR